MRISLRLGSIVATVLLLAACSKDDDAFTPEPPAPQGPDYLLLTACSNEALHRMVTEQIAIDQSIDLFDSYIEEGADRIKAADLIFLLVSGDRMNPDDEQDLLYKKWETTLRPVADKIIIIYDATTGRGETLSKTVGVDAGPGYYIKAMGTGGYCKMLAPEELTPEALVESIRFVQGHAALGDSNEGDVQTFRFVKTARFALCQDADVKYYADNDKSSPKSPTLFTGKEVDRLDESATHRSVLGNFLVEYTIYLAPGAKEKYVQIDLKGGGYTTNMTFFKGTKMEKRSGAYNMPITYFATLSASGTATGKLPEVKKVLPASDNRSASVSESSGFSIGFSAAKDPSLSFGYSWSNTVAYDQSEWETKIAYRRDMATNTVSHTWTTLPVYVDAHEPGSFVDGHWEFPYLHHPSTDHLSGELVSRHWNLVDQYYKFAYLPNKWPVTYSDFQPRHSMLVMTEGDVLEVEVEAGVVIQHYQKALSKYWVYGSDRSFKVTCSHKIHFSDYMLQ